MDHWVGEEEGDVLSVRKKERNEFLSRKQYLLYLATCRTQMMG